MKKSRSSIAPEGLTYIGVLAVSAWLAAIFGFSYLSFLIAGATIFTLYFFRDPEREIPEDPHAVVSPADGKVIAIENVVEDDFLNHEMKKLSISLAITDCHINRVPVSGEVAGTKYVEGKFHMANFPGRFFTESRKRKSERNERLSIYIKSSAGEGVIVSQVAGFLARRIVSYAETGMSFLRGERFGMIKFGSRVDIYLPLRCEVTAEVGDRVRGGETIIGWLRETGD